MKKFKKTYHIMYISQDGYPFISLSTWWNQLPKNPLNDQTFDTEYEAEEFIVQHGKPDVLYTIIPFYRKT